MPFLPFYHFACHFMKDMGFKPWSKISTTFLPSKTRVFTFCIFSNFAQLNNLLQITYFLRLLNSRNPATAPNQRLLLLSSFPFTMGLPPSCTTNTPVMPTHDHHLLRALLPVHPRQCTLPAHQSHELRIICPMRPLHRLKCSQTWSTQWPHQREAHRIPTSCTNSRNPHRTHHLLHTLQVSHHLDNLRSSSHSP